MIVKVFIGVLFVEVLSYFDFARIYFLASQKRAGVSNLLMEFLDVNDASPSRLVLHLALSDDILSDLLIKYSFRMTTYI